MRGLEFYQDDAGSPKARGRDQRLATYLETDVQDSTEIARELVACLADQTFRGDITGNAHSLTISAKTATIESLYDDDMPARRLSRKQLHDEIKRWLIFIS
ncbi:MAG: hypothetical protein KTR33_13565 [Gammaproteobacteria bacterium]|nr:hypothetical protein [Gammaproteobacteria bacterium]